MTTRTSAPPGAVADAVAASNDVAKPEPVAVAVDVPATEQLPATLAESLVRALGVLQNVTKGRRADIEHKTGGSHTIRYADLGDTLAAVRPVLARFGLAIIQEVTTDNRLVTVRTTLLHWTGQERVSAPLSLASGGLPQDVASAITYGRRYQLTAMLGLGADDDDGKTANDAAARVDERQELSITAARADRYVELATEAGLSGDDIRTLVDEVTKERTNDVRMVLESEYEHLRARTAEVVALRRAIAARDAEVGPEPDDADAPS